jgi:hypothetical protein
MLTAVGAAWTHTATVGYKERIDSVEPPHGVRAYFNLKQAVIRAQVAAQRSYIMLNMGRHRSGERIPGHPKALRNASEPILSQRCEFTVFSPEHLIWQDTDLPRTDE